MTEWVSAKQLIAGLEAGHGRSYALVSAPAAVFKRLSAGLLGWKAVRILLNGKSVEGMPSSAWQSSRSGDWEVGDFQLVVKSRGPRLSPYDRGTTRYEVYGVEFSAADAAAMGALFKTEPSTSTDDVPAPPLSKRGRGRPPKWDWPGATSALTEQDSLDDWFAEVLEGKRTQSSLEQYMLSWFCDRNGGSAPDQSDVRERVRGLLQARRERNAQFEGGK